MNVLLVAHDYSLLRGVQTFVWTLSRALIQAGCRVFIYAPQIGEVWARETAAFGVRLSSSWNELRSETFDALVVNGFNPTAYQARFHFPDSAMAFIVHTPEPAFLPFEDPQIGRYLAICERTREVMLE